MAILSLPRGIARPPTVTSKHKAKLDGSGTNVPVNVAVLTITLPLKLGSESTVTTNSCNPGTPKSLTKRGSDQAAMLPSDHRVLSARREGKGRLHEVAKVSTQRFSFDVLGDD